MMKVWIIVGLIIVSLSGALYWQISKNGELSTELKQKNATIEQAEKDIKDLAIRLSASQEISRRAVQKHQERVRSPDVSMEALEKLLEETSK